MSLQHWPEAERPREKLLRLGSAALSEAELLAIVEELNADPAVHDDVTVSGIRVLDPLYPHGSKAWGLSPKPNGLIKPSRPCRIASSAWFWRSSRVPFGS